jgi:hypothetical protein
MVILRRCKERKEIIGASSRREKSGEEGVFTLFVELKNAEERDY